MRSLNTRAPTEVPSKISKNMGVRPCGTIAPGIQGLIMIWGIWAHCLGYCTGEQGSSLERTMEHDENGDSQRKTEHKDNMTEKREGFVYQ